MTQSDIVERVIDVIVVEDDEDSRLMMAALLTSHDFLVRAFATAEAALAAALQRAPDVLVTDVWLGATSGGALAERLRAEPRTRTVALIAVSGHEAPRDLADLPFDAYAQKPVDTAGLVALVRKLAGASRAARRLATRAS